MSRREGQDTAAPFREGDAGEKPYGGRPPLPCGPERAEGSPQNGKRRESRGRALLPRRVMRLFNCVA